jgi:hypothetical protein
MGKQKKAKAQRRAQRQAVTAPKLTWHDDEGIHIVAPGVPQPGDEEKMSENFQKQIRNSPLWSQMVAEYGEEKATELLKQCKAEIRK